MKRNAARTALEAKFVAVEGVKGGSVGNERDELLDEEVLLAGSGSGAGAGAGAGAKGGLRFANEDRAAASMGHMAAVSTVGRLRSALKAREKEALARGVVERMMGVR